MYSCLSLCLYMTQLLLLGKFEYGGGPKVKIAACQVFVTLPYFCWQLAFYQHLPTSGRQNTVEGPAATVCLSTVHLLPYMWTSFYPLDPSRYLFSFSRWRPKTKKFPFFTNFHGHLQKKFVGLLRTQF